MSLKSYTYSLGITLLLTVGNCNGQLFSDPGMMSGSGLTVIPTSTIAPPMEYRVQLMRMNYLRKNSRGMNLLSLTAGLSTTLEGYIRFSSEQSGTFTSQIAYGFGGKFSIPVLLPVVRRMALWTEVTSTDQTVTSAIFPSDAFRAGAIATLDSNGIYPSLLVGISRVGTGSDILLGAGVMIAAGNKKQIGFEIVHGYLGHRSFQITSSASMRVFRNIALQVCPGYLTAPSGSTWTISLGLSFSTTDIDFHPVAEEIKGDEFILPSIEELERQEKKGQPAPEGSSLNGSLWDSGLSDDNSIGGTEVSKGSGSSVQLSEKLLYDNQPTNKTNDNEKIYDKKGKNE